MYITLRRSKDYNEDFAFFLARYIRKFYVARLHYEKYDKLTKLLNEQVAKGSKRKLSAARIVTYGFNSLIVKCYKDSFSIEIDKRKKVPFFNDYTIEQLCRLVNYGTADVKGTFIFTSIFNDVKNNIDKIYNVYLSGVIV